VSDLHNTYFRPRERLLSTELVGTDAFREATGLGRKWLAIMQDWGVITHGARDREEYQRLRDTPRRRKSRRPSAHPG
jgi:hypothetical protein